MPIEPAVRETGCGHEIGEPDAIDTLCAKLARRRLDDLDACRGRFLARLSHRMCPPNRSMWAATNRCTVIAAWPVTRRWAANESRQDLTSRTPARRSSDRAPRTLRIAPRRNLGHV